MARKPRDHKAEYLARRARGEAKGLTPQQARGHVAGEHIIRAERRRAAGRLTSTEESFLNRVLPRIEARGGVTAAERRRLAKEAFEKMTPAERDEIRAEQRRRSRGKKPTENRYGTGPASGLLLSRKSGPRNLRRVA